MIYDEAKEYHDRDALIRLVEVARTWAPTRSMRTDSGNRHRLADAVTALAGVDVEDLFSAIFERGQESGREQERAVHDFSGGY